MNLTPSLSVILTIAIAITMVNAHGVKPVVLSKSNFLEALNAPSIGSLVMYFAPWCGHCKRMTSVWQLLAEKHNSNGKFQIAHVDCTLDAEFCSEQEVLGYPKIVFYPSGSASGRVYENGQTLEEIEKYLLRQLGASGDSAQAAAAAAPEPVHEEEKPVKDLDQSNFKEHVAEGLHFIKFYTPWCGHCKTLAPIWNELSIRHEQSTVKFSQVDCTLNSELCTAQELRGFPTLLVFHNGLKVEYYTEERTLEKLSHFVDDMLIKYDENTVVVHTIGDIFQLDEDTFLSVLGFPGVLFVRYVEHCKDVECENSQKVWSELAERMKYRTSVIIGQVDCTLHVEFCQKQGVASFPESVLYSDGEVVGQPDKLDIDSLEAFVKKHLKHDEL